MRKAMHALNWLLIVISLPAIAQKKEFTYEQIFKGAPLDLYQPLPDIRGWADDEHYLELRKGADGKSSLFAVEAKSGNATPYTGLSSDVADDNKNEGDKRNITPSPDGRRIAYTKKDNNLYVLELSTKKETPLTADGNDSLLNGYASWVYYEEILGRPSRYRAFWWGPDSKQIAYMRFNESGVPVFPIYWSDGQHGYLENQRYPKAGDKNPEVKIGIVNVTNSTTIWADFNEKDDQYFGPLLWTPEGQLWVQWMNRGQDNLKIYAIDRNNGSKKEVYDEKQSTWINLHEGRRLDFIEANKSFLVKSDKDGWENLYLYNRDGRLMNPVTNGTFWGTTVIKIDEKAQVIYFQARKENPARFDFYKIGLNGKGLTRLTFGGYSHDQVSLSPSGKYFITTYSNIASPPAMALVDNKGNILRELGSARGAGFSNYNLPATGLVHVKSGDGLFELPVVITYPIHFDPAKKYPILISIYGGPNAGTVYDRWRLTGPALWWAQEGLIQVSMDNRSSGHFGKKGMNFIHRRLGKYEIEDYMTCGKWLRSQPWADTNKVCITGGSFGGFMTCMALTYGADVFNYGVANSSVTDWKLYDTHYTERFMDKPQENEEGYGNISPVTFAGRYKGLLRIVHGTSDDNVHMQNSIQLIDKLEDLKKHFEFMLYPGERHGIGANDPIKGVHNRTEAAAFYYKWLLEKPMPETFWK